MKHFCSGCKKPVSEVGKLKLRTVYFCKKWFCKNCLKEFKTKNAFKKRFDEVFDK